MALKTAGNARDAAGSFGKVAELAGLTVVDGADGAVMIHAWKANVVVLDGEVRARRACESAADYRLAFGEAHNAGAVGIGSEAFHAGVAESGIGDAVVAVLDNAVDGNAETGGLVQHVAIHAGVAVQRRGAPEAIAERSIIAYKAFTIAEIVPFSTGSTVGKTTVGTICAFFAVINGCSTESALAGQSIKTETWPAGCLAFLSTVIKIEAAVAGSAGSCR